jgi:hypothetical protein
MELTTCLVQSLVGASKKYVWLIDEGIAWNAQMKIWNLEK